jgi:hypothetical protein
LPVPYFHVVFSLPAEVADIAYQNKAVIYDILFKASAEAITNHRGRPQAPMEAHMVRRTDRPLPQARVSFEATRFGPQHLIEAYARLVPTVRRASRRPKRSDAQPSQAKVMIVAGSGGEA